MQKLKQKQLQQLRKQHQDRQRKYSDLLNQLINSSEQVQETLLFSQQIYNEYLAKNVQNNSQKMESMETSLELKTSDNSKSNPHHSNIQFNISDYTPASISKLIFADHLAYIKKKIDKMPNKQCRLEHFLIIMMKVLWIDTNKYIKNKDRQRQINRKVILQQQMKLEDHLQSIQLSPTNQSPRVSSPLKRSPNSISKIKNSLPDQRQTSLQNSPNKKAIKPSSNSEFDKYPFYLIALRQMFKEIQSEPSPATITYPQLEKFILGEIVHLNKLSENTEFAILFEQSKKQDFLLHDMGIRKILYCKSLKIYLCLDHKANHVKIYNQDMKCKISFWPNKLKHARRQPQILDMCWADISNTLGLVLANKTIQIINLQHFITKPQKQFLLLSMNQIVTKFENDNAITSINYLSMSNKWLIIGQKNELILMDCSKYRSRQDQLIICYNEPKNEKPELKLSAFLEIIPLSLITLVSGNQIWFYNETMKKKKFKNYVHPEIITSLKYYEQNNLFILLGKQQKFLTLLRPIKNRQSLDFVGQISFGGRRVLQFQYFPIYSVFVVIDDKNQVRLIDQISKKQYQLQQYNRIVKANNNKVDDEQSKIKINMLKLSRESFIIFQSYMVSLCLNKVAIETQIQFEFLPYSYFGQEKQQFYVSFNNQLLTISLLEGLVRQSYNYENSNIEQPLYFAIDNGQSNRLNNGQKEQTKPFIIDINEKIYDLYLKDAVTNTQGDIEQQSRKYKKKLEIKDVIFAYYDQQLKRCLLVTSDPFFQLHQIKNNGQNTFKILNMTTFTGMEIQDVYYSPLKKSLFFNCLVSLSQSQSESQLSQVIVQCNINHLQTHNRVLTYQFEKQKVDDKPQIIIKFAQIEQYGLDIILTDQNIVYLIENQLSPHQQQKRFICVKLYFFVAPKLREVFKFNQMYMEKVKDKNRKNYTHYSLIFTTEQGFILELKLNVVLAKQFHKKELIEEHEKPSLQQILEINYKSIQKNCISYSKVNSFKNYQFTNKQQQTAFIKAHSSKIQIVKKIQMQLILLLTIGKDGFLKIWNSTTKQCIICLKFPNMRKDIFQIKQIQNIRTNRQVEKGLQVVKKMKQSIFKKQQLRQILHITRQHKFAEQKYEKIDENQPFKFDIENKSLQELIYEPQTYMTLLNDHLTKKYHQNPHKRNSKSSKSKVQDRFELSVKKQKQFQNMMQKSLVSKANNHQTISNIPNEILELRRPLRMYEKHKSLDISEKANKAKEKQELLILPQIKEYQMQPTGHSLTQRKTLEPKPQVDQQQYDSFESCVFVKNKVGRKKANELDKIDKEFIRKQYSLLAKKNLAKRKDAVKITNRIGTVVEKAESQEIGDIKMNLQTIMTDIRRIRHETRFGGQRHIPKVKFSKSEHQI